MLFPMCTLVTKVAFWDNHASVNVKAAVKECDAVSLLMLLPPQELQRHGCAMRNARWVCVGMTSKDCWALVQTVANSGSFSLLSK